MMPADHLTKLYVELTTRCNLDCQMCVRRAWQEPIGDMARETYLALVDQIRALPVPPTVHFSGFGEPLYHPDVLGIIAMVKETGAKVEMTTNGMLLDRNMAALLVDLDVDRIVFSLDAATPGHYQDIRVRGEFEQVLANMRDLRRVKLRYNGRHGKPETGIAFVAMRQNVDDLPKLPKLAVLMGAAQIIVSNVAPHTPEMEEEILYGRSLRACAYRASRWVADLSLPKLDYDQVTMAPLQQTYNSTASLSLLEYNLSDRNDYCRFAQEGYAAVRWDGAVSPCLSLMHDHPEYIHGRRKDITHHTFGNVNEVPLLGIWQSHAFSTFRQQLREFNFSPCTTCGGCERFPYNYEDCTGNDFPTCGGCLWAQGFIQCP